MKRVKNILKLVLCLGISGISAALAQDTNLSALSRVDTTQSSISDRLFGDVDIKLALSQAVPFRVFTLDSPNRVVLDFREVEWSSADAISVQQSEKVGEVRFGIYQPGWSRLVLQINEPMTVRDAEMDLDQTKGTALLTVRLTETSQEKMDAASKLRPDSEWDVPVVTFTEKPRTRQIGDRPIVIALDAGHGGIDPGAVVEGYKEKELVLAFATELREMLTKTGRYEAFLTREGDSFMSLTGRISQARRGDADVMISLHADALSEGSASGITVYTLSTKASNQAAAQLAAQLDRSDLLSGVDLSEQDDQVASVLMDLARVETNARSEDLAGRLVTSIAEATQRSRKRPQLSAGFTVLKAPDIPSVLIELGFLTNRKDLKNLLNAEWRKRVQTGIVQGLGSWAVEDAAQAQLLRK
jgi:N-acetylmuramoyl-L-alanine amidase